MNDTIFLCKVDIKIVTIIKIIKSILRCFELTFKIGVNFYKTKIGDIGVDESNLEKFSIAMNNIIMSTPFKYLGSWVGKSKKSWILATCCR